ncbi:hypothetical protein FGIG_05931 [Fasciola gigantica]|uniref:PH domain-containing protein n=1 Tax=Fasciola gigantica TaxID=46835 RepID=A0A504Z9D0_FASGI|nr:hypothetical protein FGIG_05931 [Fasciola gigantica]
MECQQEHQHQQRESSERGESIEKTTKEGSPQTGLPEEVPQEPSTSSDQKYVRQAVALRLRNLELVNQRLNEEKSQLEHQLIHVLERLATGKIPGISDREQAMTKNEAREFICSLMGDSVTGTKGEHGSQVPSAAPLAEPDSSGLRDSLVESNSLVSGFDYSSLSDAYEEICLRKDLVEKMVQSESSNFSFKGDVVESPSQIELSTVEEPTIPLDQRDMDAYEEICLRKDLVEKMVQSESSNFSFKGDVVESPSQIELSTVEEPTVPLDQRDMGNELGSFPRRKPSAILLFSKNQAEKQPLAEKRFETPAAAQEQDGQIVTGAEPAIEPVVEGTTEQLSFMHGLYPYELEDFLTKDDRIEVPPWLSRVSQTSSLSLMNVSAKCRAYDTESVPSSSRSCSIFSSSTSSRSSSPVMPLVPSFVKQILPKRNAQLSSSMPTSPLWPVSAHRKEHFAYEPEAKHSADTTCLLLSPDERTRIGVHGSLHALERTAGKIPTREELIKSMRQMYGLPLGTVKNMPEAITRNIPKRSTSDHVPVTDSSRITSTGPPKVRISRRHIQQPVTLEESSDTTSTTSRNNHLEFAGPRRVPKPSRLRESPSITPGVFDVISYPGRIRTRGFPPMSVSRTHVPELYSPQTKWKHRNQLGRSTDFLSLFAEFGQQLPTKASTLLSPSDSAVLSFISKLINGLDAYTCSQGRAILLQCVQPSFASITPILISQEVVCHSHESSDLTSELSSNTRRPENAEGPQPGPSHGWQQTNWRPSDFESSQKKPEPTKDPTVTYAHTLGSRSDETQEVKPILSDQIIMHQGLIFRLSNRVKIWRRYWAVLNPSNLLLHTHQQPSIQAPKRCILLSDIQSIRKPHILSASITTGMVTTSGSLEQERQGIVVKYRNGSVPVTRKLAQLHQESLGRTNYGHFEIILNSG